MNFKLLKWRKTNFNKNHNRLRDILKGYILIISCKIVKWRFTMKKFNERWTTRPKTSHPQDNSAPAQDNSPPNLNNSPSVETTRPQWKRYILYIFNRHIVLIFQWFSKILIGSQILESKLNLIVKYIERFRDCIH